MSTMHMYGYVRTGMAFVETSTNARTSTRYVSNAAQISGVPIVVTAIPATASRPMAVLAKTWMNATITTTSALETASTAQDHTNAPAQMVSNMGHVNEIFNKSFLLHLIFRLRSVGQWKILQGYR